MSKKSTSFLRRCSRVLAQIALGIVLLGVVCTLPLRWLNPPTTAFILLDSMEPSGTRTWTNSDELPEHLLLAIVAAEDQKFPHHFGFDLEAISDALSEDTKRTRGASTVTQQLAKNLYLWPGRSFVRKGIEAYLTIFLELFLPKRRILEIYVNVVEFGPGVFGIGNASSQLFNKKPIELTRTDASLLVAALPNPKRRSVQNPSAYHLGRAATIRRMMRQLGDSYLQANE